MAIYIGGLIGEYSLILVQLYGQRGWKSETALGTCYTMSREHLFLFEICHIESVQMDMARGNALGLLLWELWVPPTFFFGT